MGPQGNEELGAAASAPIATALGVGMLNICISARASASWLTAWLIDGSVASAIIGVAVGAGRLEVWRRDAGNLDWRPRRERALGFGFDFSLFVAAGSAGVLAICIGAGASARSINSWAMDETGLGAAASLFIEAALGACSTGTSASSISAGAIDEIGLGGAASEFVKVGIEAGALASCIGTSANDETGLAVLSTGASTS
jgi:hypothetical protein